jgi:hypothetical protein
MEDAQEATKATALEKVAQKAAAAAEARAAYRAATEALRQEIHAADRVKAGRNRIADAAEPGMTRRLVFEALGAFDIQSHARDAIGRIDVVHLRRAGAKVFLDLEPEDLGSYEDEDEDEDEEERSGEQAETDYSRGMNLLGALALQLRDEGLRMAAPRDDLYDLLLVEFESVEIVKIAE